MNLRRLIITLAIGGAVGLSIFAAMVWQVTSVERIGSSAAIERFETIRDSVPTSPPVLSFDAKGSLTRTPPPAESKDTASPSVLRVMAYRGPQHGLVQVDVPFWFLRLKMPAVQYVLRDTDVDLGELGLTSKELALYGPCIVLDQTRSNGDRVLIWME